MHNYVNPCIYYVYDENIDCMNSNWKILIWRKRQCFQIDDDGNPTRFFLCFGSPIRLRYTVYTKWIIYYCCFCAKPFDDHSDRLRYCVDSFTSKIGTYFLYCKNANKRIRTLKNVIIIICSRKKGLYKRRAIKLFLFIVHRLLRHLQCTENGNDRILLFKTKQSDQNNDNNKLFFECRKPFENWLKRGVDFIYTFQPQFFFCFDVLTIRFFLLLFCFVWIYSVVLFTTLVVIFLFFILATVLPIFIGYDVILTGNYLWKSLKTLLRSNITQSYRFDRFSAWWQ